MQKLPTQTIPARLIALDLDDTLLDSHTQISDGNVRALQRAAALGIYIVICSGRAEDASCRMCAALTLPACRPGGTSSR